MKKSIYPLLAMTILLGGLTVHAQSKVNVVKSIPITVDKVSSTVPVSVTNPVVSISGTVPVTVGNDVTVANKLIVERINQPVLTVSDNTTYNIAYSAKIIPPGTSNTLQDIENETQLVLTDYANKGWELVAVSLFTNPEGTGAPRQTYLLIFAKKTRKP